MQPKYDHLLINSMHLHDYEEGIPYEYGSMSLEELYQSQKQLEKELQEWRRHEPSVKRSEDSRTQYRAWVDGSQSYIQKLSLLRDEIIKRKEEL